MLDTDTLTAPSVGIFDEPTRCYSINLEWSKYVMGMVSLLAESKLWNNATDEDYFAIQEIQKFLIGMDCMDCNDVKDCLDTDPTAISSVTIQYGDIQDSTQTQLDQWNADYDGSTAQSVFPDIPTVAPQGNTELESALCASLYAFIEIYATTKAIAVEETRDGILGVWDSYVNAVKNVWSDIKNAVSGIWDSLTGETDEQEALNALNDTQQIKDLACCLNAYLVSLSMSETNYSLALNDCDTTNALGALALADLDNTDSYLFFLNIYNEYTQRTNSGESFLCPCDYDWCFEWDFRQSEHEWILYASNGVVAGEYVAGSGYKTTFNSGTQLNTQRVNLRNETGGIIKRIEIDYTLHKLGTIQNISNNNHIRFGEIQVWKAVRLFDGITEGASLTWGKTVPSDDFTNIEVEFFAGVGLSANGDPGGNGIVRKIRAYGSGVCPYGTPNC